MSSLFTVEPGANFFWNANSCLTAPPSQPWYRPPPTPSPPHHPPPASVCVCVLCVRVLAVSDSKRPTQAPDDCHPPHSKHHQLHPSALPKSNLRNEIDRRRCSLRPAQTHQCWVAYLSPTTPPPTTLPASNPQYLGGDLVRSYWGDFVLHTHNELAFRSNCGCTDLGSVYVVTWWSWAKRHVLQCDCSGWFFLSIAHRYMYLSIVGWNTSPTHCSVGSHFSWLIQLNNSELLAAQRNIKLDERRDEGSWGMIVVLPPNWLKCPY